MSKNTLIYTIFYVSFNFNGPLPFPDPQNEDKDTMAVLHHIIIIMSMSNGSFNKYRLCWLAWNGARDVNVCARIRSGTHDRLIKI